MHYGPLFYKFTGEHKPKSLKSILSEGYSLVSYSTVVPLLWVGRRSLSDAYDATGQATSCIARLQTLIITTPSQVISLLMNLQQMGRNILLHPSVKLGAFLNAHN